jgi:uncharacterized cupin superfamily protein
VNVFAGSFAYDPEDPPGYQGGAINAGAEAGGSELSVKLYELPAGESLCPYHYETVEEWLLLLDGELELRTPDGTERLARGALVCFSAGPEGAHKVTTPRGGQAARFVMFSSAAEPVVAVYPDSDKVGVWVPGGADNVLLHRRDGRAGYYDGELGGEPSR